MQIQPIDITQIIVAVITFAGVVYSVRPPKPPVGSKTKTAPQKLRTRTIVMFVSVILLVANLGVLSLRYWGSTTEVKITYPDNGANAEIREMVRGASQKIPEGRVIWIAVYPHIVGRYYPQNDPASVQANGDWTSLTFIGIEEDTGKKFDIIAVLADQNAQNAFADYLIQAKDKKTSPGLEKLPEGALEYNRITVTRK